MKTQEAIDYFGGQRQLAQALNIWPHSFTRNSWEGHPPELRQYQLQVITGGALRVEPELDVRYEDQRGDGMDG